ncbi:MAG: DUF975 domain-containing protein [Actinomycetota bacterium]
MPKNPILSEANAPLSVGNVVSAGLRIYRDRFKLYYGLAFIAYLWILIPIYGWAKFSAGLGLISRLAFSEVRNRPETVSEARRIVEPRKWSLWGAGFLVGLILIGVFIGGFLILSFIGGFIGGFVGREPSISSIVISFLVGAVAIIAFLFGYIWFFSRLSLVELCLAIEDDPINASSAISRSWQLTKGFVLRLQVIFFVAFLITLPVSVLVQIVTTVAQLTLAGLIPKDSSLFALLYFLVTLLLAFVSGALLLPFWQAIKAVIYYDLRTRKEGLGLQMRDADLR